MECDKLKRSTFNYIKDILREYPDMKQYIEERKEEIRNPYKPTDLNADIKGGNANSDSMVNTMITMESDRRLNLLERNHSVISKLMKEVDDETLIIIRELYMKKFPKYTLTGLCEDMVIKCSRNTASKKRNVFFDEVAKRLDLSL